MQCGQRLAEDPVGDDDPPRDAPANAPGSAAERRQLTVMFCDLVGSTALSERLDPEELRQVLRSYQAAAGAVIQRYDGHIAQYLGDGLLVYFGFPLAHEDSARRATGAGLGIVEAIEQINPRLREQWQAELFVRIAVHTGLVVAGEVGYGGARERLAMGKTLNLAARLQDHAPPNGLVVSAATLRLIEGYFVYESLGSRLLKGIAQPEALYLIHHASEAHSRFDAAERLSRELELNVQIAVPLTLTQGWAAPEVRRAYERAYELCQRVEDSPLFFPVLHGMFRFYLVNADHQVAEDIAARDLERVERTGDDGAILEFTLHPGVVRFYTGRFSAALPYLKRCVSLYDEERHRDHADTYSACPATIATAHMANALAVLGQPDAAFEWNRRSAHYAAQADHLFSRIWAMSNHAMNHILYEDHRRCAELAERMIEAAEEHGFVNWASQGRVWLGWSQVRGGEVDAGLSTMLSGIELWDLTGAKLMRPFYFALLADAYRTAGRLDEAQGAVDAGFSTMTDTGEIWTRPLNEILGVCISYERGTLAADAADARLGALSESALARHEALWAVRAERDRLRLASARGQVPDRSGWRELLARFDNLSPYPLLHDATGSTEHNPKAVAQ
jgi:class 3 adenylate cyclase